MRPAQALELSARLESAREQARLLQKQVDALQDQLSRSMAEKARAEQTLQVRPVRLVHPALARERSANDTACVQEQSDLEQLQHSASDAKPTPSGPGWPVHASMVLLGSALVSHGSQLYASVRSNTLLAAAVIGVSAWALVMFNRRRSLSAWLSAAASLSAFFMSGCMLMDFLVARFPKVG